MLIFYKGHLPTIWMSIIAVSIWFSTWTVISYLPEWLRSALRMKMMLSQSVLRMLTCDCSMGWPSFSQVTFGRGLPCKKHPGFISLLKKAQAAKCLGHSFTMNGTTRLTASPTLRVYVCFKCRGTRIFGGSEKNKSHQMFMMDCCHWSIASITACNRNFTFTLSMG